VKLLEIGPDKSAVLHPIEDVYYVAAALDKFTYMSSSAIKDIILSSSSRGTIFGAKSVRSLETYGLRRLSSSSKIGNSCSRVVLAETLGSRVRPISDSYKA